jgi:hypothetical protein
VRAFDVLSDGRVTNERLFVEQPGTDELMDGAPDGMACDERGNLWATGLHGVWVVDATGRVLGVVRTPKFASNVCFGGPEWAYLYITCTDSVCRLRTRTRGARDAHVIQGELQCIALGLREGLGCSRVTVRVDDIPSESFRVKAEACAPGVLSIAAHRTEGVRESETFQWIDRERRVLVQNDIAASPIAPAPVLLGMYGVRAQLLAPVVVDNEVRGIISIHEADLREWRDEDVAVASAASESVASVLGG